MKLIILRSSFNEMVRGMLTTIEALSEIHKVINDNPFCVNTTQQNPFEGVSNTIMPFNVSLLFLYSLSTSQPRFSFPHIWVMAQPSYFQYIIHHIHKLVSVMSKVSKDNTSWRSTRNASADRGSCLWHHGIYIPWSGNEPDGSR